MQRQIGPEQAQIKATDESTSFPMRRVWQACDGDRPPSPTHDLRMQLPTTLAWLLDEASASTGADRFLAALGARLIADGLPLVGGALTLAVPHPIIARRTWLWRAETGAVIEALG